VVFGRVLRRLGVPVTTGQVIDFLSAIQAVGVRNQDDVRLCGRCTLVSSRRDTIVFDLAFDAFWDREDGEYCADRRGPSRLLVSPGEQEEFRHTETADGDEEARSLDLPSSFLAAERPNGYGGADEPEVRFALYSPLEAIRDKDFATFSAAELEDARAFLYSIEWALAHRLGRRRKPSSSGGDIDMRKLLRHSLRHGGEILDLPRRGPRPTRRGLVVLCDISGSMDRYSRMLLHFLHALGSSFDGAEVFVFGTRLTRITHSIRRRDPDEALSSVGAAVHDWAGGTRIGDAIATFNRTWSRRVAAHGAIVLIISDGWDRGEPEKLRTEIQRLQRSSYRLTWLNPLLGAPQYEPATRGMAAALPYVDDFLPCHNLTSLQSLAVLLNQLSAGKPGRWRRPQKSRPPSGDRPVNL
jgi:uncharacterized protein with von Willebrand factor type A (vWA) domain